MDLRRLCFALFSFYLVQSVSGHPVAWVNNQFRHYIFDISDFLASPSSHDNNLTVSFESAWYYGLNVTARPDAEFFPGLGYVSINEKSCQSSCAHLDRLLSSSLNTHTYIHGYGK